MFFWTLIIYGNNIHAIINTNPVPMEQVVINNTLLELTFYTIL